MAGVHIEFIADFYKEGHLIDAGMRQFLWQELEMKLGGGRDELLGSLRRCRIVAYDTQEVNYRRFEPSPSLE